MLEVLMGSLEFVLSLLMSSLTIGRITDKSAHKICLQMTSIYNTTYIFYHIIIYPALIGTCAFSFILCSVYSSWIKRTEELWRLNQAVKQMDLDFFIIVLCFHMNDESLLEKFKCFVCDLFLGGVAAGRLSGSHSKFKHLIVKRTMRPLCRRWFWEADCGADTWSPAKVIEVSDIRAPRPPWEKQVQAVMCRGFLEWPLKATDWQNKRRIKKTEEAVRVQTAQQLHLHLTFQAFSWGTLEIKKKW